ncbi:hypothetical protein QWY85_12425 [Neolewinella lacunae]|uniref:Uracil-DNA glycosylase n=1 Tax=Neolewinella lacunae TaxID=1517758 RepID=A0A923PP34_9BACT|nr:hypothetical protein [Neolewinella lacunae]MBC6995221.1 hypothetical protein [Neolewinella lacunae]MDN3635470.1 hypothetical protein [Neolewinella lacunae]
MNKEIYQDRSFDDLLQTLPHYQLYPQMLPFIGSHYRRMNKRVLVIGESHYLRKESEQKSESGAWYDGTAAAMLDDEDRNWIHTRGTAGSGEKQRYASKAFGIYRNVEFAIRDLLVDKDLPTDNYLRYVAYYNYFQRPAKTGDSLEVTDLDKKTAYHHLLALGDILEVTHFAFVSKLAYYAFWKSHGKDEFFTRNIFGTAHPSTSWWNTPHQHDWWEEKFKMTSREWFIKRIGKLQLKVDDHE